MKELKEKLTLAQKEKTFQNDKKETITYKRYVLYVNGYVFDLHKCLSANDKLVLAQLFESIKDEK